MANNLSIMMAMFSAIRNMRVPLRDTRIPFAQDDACLEISKSNEKNTKEDKSYKRLFSKSNIIIVLFFLSLIIYSIVYVFNGKSEEKQITYNAVGYATRFVGSSGSRDILFVHNDKYGDFTFTVTPKTVFDVKNGYNVVTFENDYYDLVRSADN